MDPLVLVLNVGGGEVFLQRHDLHAHVRVGAYVCLEGEVRVTSQRLLRDYLGAACRARNSLNHAHLVLHHHAARASKHTNYVELGWLLIAEHPRQLGLESLAEWYSE